MFKKKRNLLLTLGLISSLAATSTIAITLSACSSTTSSTSDDVQYSYVIDWNDKNVVDRLIIDDNGLVYSDNTKTTIIATSPRVMINTITIPSTVKNIAGYVKVTTNSAGIKVYQQVGAFQDNLSLNSVIIPIGSKLQSIDAYAFKGCSDLRAISSTQNASALTYIGKYAFQGCSNLADIDLENITVIDNYAFNGAFNVHEQVTANLTNVITIGSYAFAGSNVYSVDFSKNTNLYNIGSYAFNNATNLIGTIDLSGCTKLTQTGSYSFAGCTKLETVYIPSEENSNLKTINNNTFSQCTSMTTFGPKGTNTGSLVTTTKITTIGGSAFANTNITSIDASKFTVGSSGHTGSTSSFRDMRYVTSIKLPEGMVVIPCEDINNGGGYFNRVGDLGEGFDLVLPSSIADFVVYTVDNAPSSSPFQGSGLKNIDMSKIKSYSYDSPRNEVLIALFYKATKLETVVLKHDTTGFGKWAFSYCSNLKWVTIADENGTYVTPTKNGFVAPSNNSLTYNYGVFQQAFAPNSNATVDLSNSTFTTLPQYMFDSSNVKNVKLPTSVTTIDDKAFRNTTNETSKLTSINFTELTNLTTIKESNFNKSGLTSIDLSKCNKLNTINSGNGNTNSFTNLLTNCTILLPSNFTGNVSNIFTSIDSTKPVTINFPNGIPSSYVNTFVRDGSCVLKDFQNVTNNSSNLLKNATSLDLSSLTENVWSIGENTFFGSSKLASLTWGATNIATAENNTAAAGLFTTKATNIITNASNTSTSSSYAANIVPFGNNEVFKTLNYNSFSLVESHSSFRVGENDNAKQALFNKTNEKTWKEVAKIINSLSYQPNPSSTSNNVDVATLKPNMSTWEVASNENVSGKPINNDVEPTFTSGDGAKISLSNSFEVTPPSDSSRTNLFSSSVNTDTAPSEPSASNNIEILNTDASKKFIHNGITWTYTNDGSTIKLTGSANMYKLTKTAGNTPFTSYLVFFDETTHSITNSTTIYYVPKASSSVNVTLTIATKA